MRQAYWNRRNRRRGWGGVIAAVAGVGCAAGPMPAQQGAALALSDAAIAHVAVTANRIDAELAELAEPRAVDAAVRRFARTMIADHTAVVERAGALVQRLGIAPEDNPVSRSLEEDAGEVRARLRPLRAADFERSYMEHEVAYHRAVLEALDEVLIPGAENAELRELLESARPVVAAHLEHARGILGSLEDSG